MCQSPGTRRGREGGRERKERKEREKRGRGKRRGGEEKREERGREEREEKGRREVCIYIGGDKATFLLFQSHSPLHYALSSSRYVGQVL
jgi:hypothetical protein